MRAVELEEVQRLQQLVAELRVGDPLLALQSPRHGLLADHLVDPEVLADVAQEVQRRHRRRPVEVVDEDRRVCRVGIGPVEVEERPDQVLDPLDVRRRLLLGLEHALGRRSRVTDQAGRPPDQADDPVTGALEAAQHDELDEVAEVQRRGRRVESAIRRDRSAREGLAQRGLVGGQRHRSAPLQLVEDVAHGTGFPSGRSCDHAVFDGRCSAPAGAGPGQACRMPSAHREQVSRLRFAAAPQPNRQECRAAGRVRSWVGGAGPTSRWG